VRTREEGILALDAAGFQREVVEGGAAALVEFWAGWCPYSRLLPPKLERLRERCGDRLLLARVDAERHPELVAALGLRYLPALVLFRDGEPRRRLYGDRHLGELLAHLQGLRILGGEPWTADSTDESRW
jgi:thioredoxin 1